STTGPLLDVAGTVPIVLNDLPVAAKLCFAAATVLGRLETLAIIALMTPELWRK
ncbi:MAG: TrkH family potassium uptake protein, partial [Planktotalea sp.]